MKKSMLFWMCVSVIAMAAVAIAAEGTEKAKAKTPPSPADSSAQEIPTRAPGMPGQAPRGTVNREDMYKEMMARRTEMHRAEIAKIEAIIKIAEGEKATKTVEALKALIAEKDKEFKDQTEQAALRRQSRSGPASRRPGAEANGPAGGGQIQPDAAKPANPEKKDK